MGGYFDYQQYRIDDIIEQIEEDINSTEYMADVFQGHKDEDKEQFVRLMNTSLIHFRIALIFAQRYDCFMTGDDSFSSFKERLLEELKELGKVE